MGAPPPAFPPGMRVEIWSDVVCPWCYIGKRRFESALAEFEHAGEVDVHWRSFELDPSAPAMSERTLEERLAAKYGMTLDQARAANQRLTATAAAAGLDFHFERARPGNTFDAHRLIHLAAAEGLGPAVKERLLRAYFTEGEAIGEAESLVRIAAQVGLDAARAREVLAGDGFAADVRRDESEAAALGIQGVPFFVLDRRYGISGAQPPEVILGALRRAWSEAHPLSMVAAPGTSAGGVCEGDSCT